MFDDIFTKKHEQSISGTCTIHTMRVNEGLMANPASLLSYDPNADTTDDYVSQINTVMLSIKLLHYAPKKLIINVICLRAGE